MYIRTGCCVTDYTTRSYNLDGTTRWRANYFQRVSSSGIVTTQAVDSNYVYVGGTRETNGVKTWSVVCFDIDTGSFVWDYDLGSDCQVIRIDQSGNVVCMLNAGANAYNNSSPLYDQHFIRLTTAGALIDDIYFTQVNSVVNSGVKCRSTDFSINASGDYHVLIQYYGSTAAVKQSVGFYEWYSPFGSAPTLREISPQGNVAGNFVGGVRRIGSRDFIAGYTGQGTGRGGRLLSKGKSQTAALAASGDFDLNFPVCYDASLSSVSVTATGTTQAGAAALTSNTDVTVTGTGGVRLPTGTRGDVVALQRSLSTSYASFYNVYPPSGGTVSTNGVNNPYLVSSRGVCFICVSAGKWYASDRDYIIPFSGSYGALDVAVDSSSGMAIASLLGTIKTDSSGFEEWRVRDFPLGIAIDSSDNTYTTCPYYAYGSIVSRDSSGNWLWGHKHMTPYAFSAVHRPTIDMDPDGLHVIASGGNSGLGISSQNPANDINFLTNPDPYIDIGRSATATFSGTGSSYSVGFSGGAAASGTTLLAVISDDSGAGSGLSISGGSSWTQLSGGYTGAPTVKAYYKVCGGSEPTTYTVSYSGSSTGDVSCVAIIEILNANATNPDDVQVVANTATPAAASSSETTDACFLLATDFAAGTPWFDSAPTGFTLECRQENYAPLAHWTPTVAIASQIQIGVGTITPGAWGNPDTSQSYHWTVTIKKA